MGTTVLAGLTWLWGEKSRKELNELLARIKHITIDGRGLGAPNHRL